MPTIGAYQTSEELIAAFCERCGYPQPTALRYGGFAKGFAGYLDERSLSYEDVSTDVLEGYLDQQKARYALSSIVQIRAGIRAFFRWLEDEGILPDADGRVGRKHKHGTASRKKTKRPRDCATKGRAEDGSRNNASVDPQSRVGAIDESLIDRFCGEWGLSPKTARAYGSDIRIYSRYLKDAGVPFLSASVETIDEFFLWLRDETPENRAYRILTAVRTFYRWLEQNGYAENITASTYRTRAKKKARKPLSAREASLLLAAAGDQESRETALRDRAIAEMIITSGLWPFEIHQADVGDVTFYADVAFIAVRQSTRKAASVAYLPPSAASSLRKYLAFRNAENGDPLVTSCGGRNRGERLGQISISSRMSEAFKRAGIEGGLGEYSLIRTHIDLAMASGANGGEIVQMARWRNPFALYTAERVRRERNVSPQEAIESILSAATGKTLGVTSAGELRSMLAKFDDDELVVVSTGESGLYAERLVVGDGLM